VAVTPFARPIRIADRLREPPEGFAAADLAIHRVARAVRAKG
jgi:hypothetical protein